MALQAVIIAVFKMYLNYTLNFALNQVFQISCLDCYPFFNLFHEIDSFML